MFIAEDKLIVGDPSFDRHKYLDVLEGSWQVKVDNEGNHEALHQYYQGEHEWEGLFATKVKGNEIGFLPDGPTFSVENGEFWVEVARNDDGLIVGMRFNYKLSGDRAALIEELLEDGINAFAVKGYNVAKVEDGELTILNRHGEVIDELGFVTGNAEELVRKAGY